MPEQNEALSMDSNQWMSCSDPSIMLRYLEDAGCYLEFEPFYINCFERIRHELKHPMILAAAFDESSATDELMYETRRWIRQKSKQLQQSWSDSVNAELSNREIMYAKAVLAREFHDFAEANRYLSQHLLHIADDPVQEAEAQVRFLREHFVFPYQPGELDRDDRQF